MQSYTDIRFAEDIRDLHVYIYIIIIYIYYIYNNYIMIFEVKLCSPDPNVCGRIAATTTIWY